MGAPKPTPPPDIKVVFDPNSGISKNYFGGQGVPDGPGHGHMDVNEAGQPTHPSGGRPPSKP
jgi:hypothetical protein